MDAFQNLVNGFGVALTPENLFFAFVGCFVGTLVGVLPGVGPAAGTAILIPLTFQLPPTGAIIMLSSIYYGTMYGGTITSVLVNVPGETASVVTCFDGNQMAKNGRAGAALSVAAIGSFVGGTIATLGLVVAAPPLARMALQFGPPEFFGLMAVGLSLVMGLVGKSLVKALMMGVLGLLLAMIGMDPAEGIPRFTFDQPGLMGGLELVPVVMGMFGVADIFISAETTFRPAIDTRMSSFLLTLQEAKDSVWPILRGSGIGFFMGLIPGMQPSVSTFVSYVAEKRLSRHPEKFGTGIIEGVAGPETTNNAFTNAAFIPLFTLGIPTTPTLAVLMGAFMMNGLAPGPTLFTEHADFVWAVIASMYIGNAILLILNLPLIGIWVRILKIPYSILFALILAFTLIGAYSINNRPFDVTVMILFGVLGYLLRKLDFPLAPAVLTLVLAPIMERALRNSLQMSGGDFSILVTRPISAGLLIVAGLILFSSTLRFLPFRRKMVLEEAE